MRCSKAMLLLSVTLLCLWTSEAVHAQGADTPLQPGAPIERTIARGQTQSYRVSLERDQVLQLVVDQRGVDVVVRVFTPAGKSLGEFDSPNGTEGPENVSVLADAAGSYRIDVLPLDQAEIVQHRD